ncbi:cupin domain-containing protein [Microbispora sp. CA-102843]|uniref:cupin domain-containing protein n=1 Tax=Microbispora sp. CA-102843 TaxID=3239952 RepID=UPI003D906938
MTSGEAGVVDLHAPDLAWTTVPMPGAADPVRLVRLHLDHATRSSVSLVRFPSGWSRPGAGHYTCAEEFVVLDGRISVSGTDFEAGTYAYLPPGATRTATLAGGRGCLAVAWFSGAPVWRDGPAAGIPDHDPVNGPVHGSPGQRRKRSPAVPGEAAMLPSVADLPERLAEPVDLLFADVARWAYVPQGEPLPRLSGPVLVRRWSGASLTP